MARMSHGAMSNSQGCHTLGHFRDSAGGVIKNQTDWFLGFSTSVLIMQQQTDRSHCWNWEIFSSLLGMHACGRTHVHTVQVQVRMHTWRPKINCLRNSGVLFSLCLETWNSGAADATGPLHFPNTGVKSVHYDAWLFKWLAGTDLRPSCVRDTHFTHWTIHSESRAGFESPFNIVCNSYSYAQHWLIQKIWCCCLNSLHQ